MLQPGDSVPPVTGAVTDEPEITEVGDGDGDTREKGYDVLMKSAMKSPLQSPVTGSKA